MQLRGSGLRQLRGIRVLRPARGVALVELALLSTLLLLLSVGVYVFGRALQAQVVVVQAAREGARLGMNGLLTDATVQAAAVNAALPYIVTASVTHPTTTQTEVTVRYVFRSNLWLLDNFPIAATMVSRRT